MSIFSSCVGAPNSLVMTYREVSQTSRTPASPWPIPLVSTMIMENPAALSTSRASCIAADSSDFDLRVASDLMKTRGVSIEFMRMRSPSKAPPVRWRVGSTERMAMSLSGKSRRKRRTSSSVRELLPAPPVPVMPRTGTS